jgi:hypothetical protein
MVQTYCAYAPDRLLPFCSVFPRLSDSVSELYRCVEEKGARGLKLHPWLQGFSPVDSYMDKLGAAAAHLGIPIVFHDGTPPNSSPLQVAYFAERNPEVPVILGHGGLHDLWVEALVALERVHNLLVCPSGTPPAVLSRLIDSIGHSRVLFGSDIGYGGTMNPAFQQNKIRHLGLDQATEAAIFGENAERLIPPLNWLSPKEDRNG